MVVRRPTGYARGDSPRTQSRKRKHAAEARGGRVARGRRKVLNEATIGTLVGVARTLRRNGQRATTVEASIAAKKLGVPRVRHQKSLLSPSPPPSPPPSRETLRKKVFKGWTYRRPTTKVIRDEEYETRDVEWQGDVACLWRGDVPSLFEPETGDLRFARARSRTPPTSS